MAVDLSSYLSTQRGAVSTVDKNANADVLASGQSNLSSSYQTFLTLLTAQLKNQDPTAPLDTNNFTQQLVQMTGVQQQLLSNQLLKQLVSANEVGNVKDGIGLIGKTVTAAGTDAVLTSGKATWGYELEKAASSATITVADSTGRVMWTGAAPSLGTGQKSFTWDGQGTHAGVDGQTYKLTVTAKDAAGATINATTSMQGVVTAIRQGPNGALVKIGGSEAPLTSVTSVS